MTTKEPYLHHLGSSADKAGLERLNALGGAGVRIRRGTSNGRPRYRPCGGASAGGTGFRCGGSSQLWSRAFSMAPARAVDHRSSCFRCGRSEAG